MPDRERGREFPKAGPVKHKQEVEEETTDPLTVDRASHELQWNLTAEGRCQTGGVGRELRTDTGMATWALSVSLWP